MERKNLNKINSNERFIGFQLQTDVGNVDKITTSSQDT